MWWGWRGGLSKQGWDCWNQPRGLWKCFNTGGVSLGQFSTFTQKGDYFRNPAFTESSGWLQGGRDCLIAFLHTPKPDSCHYSVIWWQKTGSTLKGSAAGSVTFVPWVLRGGGKAWTPQVRCSCQVRNAPFLHRGAFIGLLGVAFWWCGFFFFLMGKRNISY